MIWKEIVCKAGRCPHKDCKHHRCHLPQNREYNGFLLGELEYEIENFPRKNKCPYGEKWIVGKGLAWRGCEVAE